MQAELDLVVKEGIAKFGTSGVSSIVTNKFEFHPKSFVTILNTSVRYIADNDIEFTEEDVKTFLDKHSTSEVNGITFVLQNENTQTVKDHLLLTIYQSILAIKESEVKNLRDKAALKYLQLCKPSIYEHIPEVKEFIDSEFEAHKAKIEEVRNLV